MALKLQDFNSLVANAGTIVQSAYTSLTNLSPGSTTRALIESFSSGVLWLQYVALQVLASSRLATSSGTDVDSFINDFGMVREAAVAANADVQFISLNPNASSASVAPGDLVTTSDATLQFMVIEDTSNVFWSDADLCYIRPQGTTSITVPTVCTTAGLAGNVSAGAINLLGSQISGIDTVTNTSPASGGADEETDSAVKTRFPVWLESQEKATETAIENAITEYNGTLEYAILNNQDPEGNFVPGMVSVLLNSGSTTVPTTIIEGVYAAVLAVLATGTRLAVTATPVTQGAVVMVLKFASSTSSTVQASVISSVTSAVTADINASDIGSGYSISRLSYLAILTGAGAVTSVPTATINGSDADIPEGKTLRTTSVLVSAS